MKPKFNVQLPKTNFPMKADLPVREPDTLARWEKLHLYHRIQEKNAAGKPFVLHDGPPYANGAIHMGMR
jgi:isoleucyl-tRNA synthetase